jgi:hypothetical protein
MERSKKIIVVMPAYNAEKTLERTLDDIPREWVDDIILVDDASRDGTVALARKLGLRVFVHDRNRGYGGNQKTCYIEAMKLGADIMIMVHPDHQYDPPSSPSSRPRSSRGRATRCSGPGCSAGIPSRAACPSGSTWPMSI